MLALYCIAVDNIAALLIELRARTWHGCVCHHLLHLVTPTQAKVSTGTTTLAAGAGTEPYIAPEVADAYRGGAAVPASDLFSFGVTMVAVLLATIFRDTMPSTTAGVMGLFAKKNGGGNVGGLCRDLIYAPCVVLRVKYIDRVSLVTPAGRACQDAPGGGKAFRYIRRTGRDITRL